MTTLAAVQLEAFIETVLLKLAEGKGITRIEQQEAALEVGSPSRMTPTLYAACRSRHSVQA